MGQKIIVYTANFGSYDTIKEPLDNLGVSFVYFTDKKTNVKVWDIRPTNFNTYNRDSQRAARYFKTNPHKVLPDHDISIWVDSSFRIDIKNYDHLIKFALGEGNIAMYKHGSSRSRNTCLYQEARVCMRANLDDNQIIQRQMNGYLREGYPQQRGLFSTGFIIRRNNDVVNKFNDLWWSEINNGSKRDQLSQQYASWKTGIEVSRIPVGDIYSNIFIKKFKHSHQLKKRK